MFGRIATIFQRALLLPRFSLPAISTDHCSLELSIALWNARNVKMNICRWSNGSRSEFKKKMCYRLRCRQHWNCKWLAIPFHKCTNNWNCIWCTEMVDSCTLFRMGIVKGRPVAALDLNFQVNWLVVSGALPQWWQWKWDLPDSQMSNSLCLCYFSEFQILSEIPCDWLLQMHEDREFRVNFDALRTYVRKPTCTRILDAIYEETKHNQQHRTDIQTDTSCSQHCDRIICTNSAELRRKAFTFLSKENISPIRFVIWMCKRRIYGLFWQFVRWLVHWRIETNKRESYSWQHSIRLHGVQVMPERQMN